MLEVVDLATENVKLKFLDCIFMLLNKELIGNGKLILVPINIYLASPAKRCRSTWVQYVLDKIIIKVQEALEEWKRQRILIRIIASLCSLFVPTNNLLALVGIIVAVIIVSRCWRQIPFPFLATSTLLTLFYMKQLLL